MIPRQKLGPNESLTITLKFADASGTSKTFAELSQTGTVAITNVDAPNLENFGTLVNNQDGTFAFSYTTNGASRVRVRLTYTPIDGAPVNLNAVFDIGVVLENFFFQGINSSAMVIQK